MSEKRKNYSPEEKVPILKGYSVEKVSISDGCHGLGVHPTVFSLWQNRFFKNGA
ncbi:transposase [Desulfosoma sp.]